MAEALEELKSFWKTKGNKVVSKVLIGVTSIIIGGLIVKYILKKEGEK